MKQILQNIVRGPRPWVQSKAMPSSAPFLIDPNSKMFNLPVPHDQIPEYLHYGSRLPLVVLQLAPTCPCLSVPLPLRRLAHHMASIPSPSLFHPRAAQTSQLVVPIIRYLQGNPKITTSLHLQNTWTREAHKSTDQPEAPVTLPPLPEAPVTLPLLPGGNAVKNNSR